MSEALKLPFQVSLARAIAAGAQNIINMRGKGLPVSVVAINKGIVTVKFEVLSDYNLPHIEVPIAGSNYIRWPIAVGDVGVVLSSDVSLAHLTGLGTGIPDMSQAPNLSALVFFPLGSTHWDSVDLDMATITGKTDVMLRDNTHQLQLETEYASWVSLISQLNLWAAEINALAPGSVTPLSPTLNPVKVRV